MLQGGIKVRCRDLIVQICDVEDAWSTGNITEEMVQEYLEHHRDPSNRESNNIILE
jgi:hypothetical protein